MRSVALIALGLGLLIIQSVTATVLSTPFVAPNLLLPIVIYVGVSPDVHLVRGALVSFVLGYVFDAFCGSPMGLQTFVLLSTFMLARGAGLRLFLRGPVFQVILTFVVSILAGGTILALRAIFERRAPFPSGTAWDTALVLGGSSLVTALTAPLVFIAVRRVDALVMRRREDAAAGTV